MLILVAHENVLFGAVADVSPGWGLVPTCAWGSGGYFLPLGGLWRPGENRLFGPSARRAVRLVHPVAACSGLRPWRCRNCCLHFDALWDVAADHLAVGRARGICGGGLAAGRGAGRICYRYTLLLPFSVPAHTCTLHTPLAPYLYLPFCGTCPYPSLLFYALMDTAFYTTFPFCFYVSSVWEKTGWNCCALCGRVPGVAPTWRAHSLPSAWHGLLAVRRGIRSLLRRRSGSAPLRTNCGRRRRTCSRRHHATPCPSIYLPGISGRR